MARRVGVAEAARVTGLSEYALRTGINAGRFPALRVGLGAGKILIDIEQLEAALTREAAANVKAPEGVINYGQLRRVAP